MQILLTIGLLSLASLSPLFTATRLWQLKEWRVDRLREHLRSEGTFLQLFGTVRPTILGLFGFFLVRRSFSEGGELLGLISSDDLLLAALGTLAALSLLQIFLGKQPRPVWTMKAIVLFGSSMILTLLIGLSIEQRATSNASIVLLPLLQPFFLALSWALFLPMDRALKRKILGRARNLRSRKSGLTVIGITGSQGKTTTKELLGHVLKDTHPLVTPEHVNSEIGVAKFLIRELPKMSDDEKRIAIIEMGAYRRGEIALLCSVAQPTYGILTSIGTQHIGLFGSQENLLRAKAELLESLPGNGKAFVNGDSDLTRKAASSAPCPATTVGTGGPLDLEAFDIEETASGIRFRCEGVPFDLKLHGTHNVTNVLLAVAAAEELGVPLARAAAILRSFEPLRHLFDVQEERGILVLDATHNASPASFQATIEWAKGQPSSPKVLLTSGLIELGEFDERTHEELGSLSSNVFERVLFTSDRSRRSFGRGYGKSVELLTRNSRGLPPGSLLACVGLVPESAMHRLLP